MACRRFSKEEYGEKSIYGTGVGPNCYCGKGKMKLWRAKTIENKGRQFYRCPDFDDHKKCFIWVDELEKDSESSKTKRSSNTIQWKSIALFVGGFSLGFMFGICVAIVVFALKKI